MVVRSCRGGLQHRKDLISEPWTFEHSASLNISGVAPAPLSEELGALCSVLLVDAAMLAFPSFKVYSGAWSVIRPRPGARDMYASQYAGPSLLASSRSHKPPLPYSK